MTNMRIQFYIVFFLQLIHFTKQQEKCSDTNKMIHAGPSFHGNIEKKGVLNPDRWMTPTNQYFKNLKQKLSDEKIELTENLELLRENKTVTEKIDFPMSVRCQVFLDPEHKIIYMKNAKTGGSSVDFMLQHGCRQELAPQEKWSKIFQCLRAPQFLEIPSAEIANEMWKNYFVFTTVRNPYSRASSAYQYLLKRRVKLNTHSKSGCKSPNFENFSLNPFILGLQSQIYECSDNKVHDYLHVEKESQCLFDENGNFVVDYIFSMENFAEDWQGLVNELEIRQGVNKSNIQDNKYISALKNTRQAHSNPVSTSTNYATQLFKNCGQKCIDNVASYYKEDFELLGYDNCLSENS